MKKKLISKFVIASSVTVAVLICVIAAGIRYIDQYIDDRYMYNELKWIMDNKPVFDDHKPEIESEMEYNGYHPIYEILLDDDKNVISITGVGKKQEESSPDQSVLESMTDSGMKGWRCGSYVYVREKTDDGYTILCTDTNYGFDKDMKQIWGAYLLLLLIGSVMSVLISLFLSRHITRPVLETWEREKSLMSDIGHELKTPISTISMNAQVLEREIPDNRYLQNIKKETERSKDLIQDLLEMSRLENTAVPLKKTMISLSDCVEEMVLSFEGIAYEKGRKYKYDLQEHVQMMGNADELQRLMEILLDNAIKYTEPEDEIEISLAEDSKGIVIKVHNSGKEIPEELQPKIFERFYMQDSSRTGDSFGLGLAIAKAITLRHGGTIGVESGKGDGTTFTISFSRKTFGSH